MSLQRTWIGACKVTLAAFAWFFSTVCSQMCPHIACGWGCIFTLVAFVQPFSTVCFQMNPQTLCMGRCKVTLVAFVRLFYTVSIQKSSWGCKIAFVWRSRLNFHIYILFIHIRIFKTLFHFNFELSSCLPNSGLKLSWFLDPIFTLANFSLEYFPFFAISEIWEHYPITHWWRTYY